MMREKYLFIRYLISRHTFKQPRTLRLLNFFNHNEEYLRDVHFVEDVTDCPRQLIVSTHEMTTIGLFYRDRGCELTDPDFIADRIIEKQGEPLYVQVNFPNWEGNERYMAVLEDHPEGLLPHQKTIQKEVDELLIELTKEAEKQRLLLAIDEALDTKNRDLFNHLTSTLANL